MVAIWTAAWVLLVAMATTAEQATTDPPLFCIRTITCFVRLQQSSTAEETAETFALAIKLLEDVRSALTKHGYLVQSIRIATNPFAQWLPVDQHDILRQRLEHLDAILSLHEVDFCSLGPAADPQHVRDICPMIIQSSTRFSCSASLMAADTDMAEACADCVLRISQTTSPDFMNDGLGNFRFAVAACCNPHIPFFPVAKAPECLADDESPANELAFAIGLENGSLAQKLLSQCGTIRNIPSVFRAGMRQALLPIQTICEGFERQHDGGGSRDPSVSYMGIDTSLNPSLAESGSVAAAVEALEEISSIEGNSFGGPGSLAAASAVTTALQSIPDIRLTGYCGLMLPLCEDSRLAALSHSQLSISKLVMISSVCGVGIDTVPLPGDSSVQQLKSLFLDVAGLAHRWDKSLSCRVFPLVGKKAGDWTTFDFPHMINAKVMGLD